MKAVAALALFESVTAFQAPLAAKSVRAAPQMFSDGPAGCFASLEAVPTAGWLQIMVLTCMQESGMGFASKPQEEDGEAGDIALDGLWVRYDDPETKTFKLNAERQ